MKKGREKPAGKQGQEREVESPLRKMAPEQEEEAE